VHLRRSAAQKTFVGALGLLEAKTDYVKRSKENATRAIYKGDIGEWAGVA
jgi:hypothetical protein